jgi:plastocyanin
MNGTYVVVIRGRAFNPSGIAIHVGTTVTWLNLDQVDHTVTSSMGIWDSGDIMPNKSFSYTFNVEGSFSYYCSDHPTMTGVVEVTP